MLLTREFSLPGRKSLLCCTIRDNISKVLVPIDDPGTLTICDKCGTEVASLTPASNRAGRVFAEWDLPLDLKPGVYTEKWRDIKFQDGRSLDKTLKLFVSDDPYCFEQTLMPDFDIRINKIVLYKPTIEAVIFTLDNPKFIIFPRTEARLSRTTTISVPLKVTVREGGPGLREPVQFISSFDEPVIIIDTDITASSEFFELTSWEDKAYFLIDTTDMIATTYKLQLKIFLGEFEYIQRSFSFTLKER